MKKLLMLICAALLPLAGCTWVELSDQGVGVRVATLSQVDQCKQLGRTTVTVVDRVAGMSRSEEQVLGELETLARNAAAEMQGDTVVAVSKVVDGEQVFNVYRCR